MGHHEILQFLLRQRREPRRPRSAARQESKRQDILQYTGRATVGRANPPSLTKTSRERRARASRTSRSTRKGLSSENFPLSSRPRSVSRGSWSGCIERRPSGTETRQPNGDGTFSPLALRPAAKQDRRRLPQPRTARQAVAESAAAVRHAHSLQPFKKVIPGRTLQEQIVDIFQDRRVRHALDNRQRRPGHAFSETLAEQ